MVCAYLLSGEAFFLNLLPLRYGLLTQNEALPQGYSHQAAMVLPSGACRRTSERKEQVRASAETTKQT